MFLEDGVCEHSKGFLQVEIVLYMSQESASDLQNYKQQVILSRVKLWQTIIFDLVLKFCEMTFIKGSGRNPQALKTTVSFAVCDHHTTSLQNDAL